MRNKQIHDLVIAAGESAGLVVDYQSIENRRLAGDEPFSVLADPIVFTLRPVQERFHPEPFWAEIEIRPIIGGDEWGTTDFGISLAFEVRYKLTTDTGRAYSKSPATVDLKDFTDFARSFPNAAACLLTETIWWYATSRGEIFGVMDDEHPPPAIDYETSLTLEIHIAAIVYPDYDDFYYAVEHYANADSEMGRAVYATLETLTLFFHWLDNKHKPSDQPRSSRHWWSAFINRWSRARERL